MPRTRRGQLEGTLLPYMEEVHAAGPIPQVPLSRVNEWVTSALLANARYLVIIFEHSLFDTVREVYGWHTGTEWQMRCRTAHIETTPDASVLQVIDLSQDINAQLVKADYVLPS